MLCDDGTSWRSGLGLKLGAGAVVWVALRLCYMYWTQKGMFAPRQGMGAGRAASAAGAAGSPTAAPGNTYPQYSLEEEEL